VFRLANERAGFLFENRVRPEYPSIHESFDGDVEAGNIVPSRREREGPSRLAEGVEQLSGTAVTHWAVVVEAENSLFAPFRHAAAAGGGERFDGQDVSLGEFGSLVAADVRETRVGVSLVAAESVPAQVYYWTKA
jgi:hypothetical protein